MRQSPAHTRTRTLQERLGTQQEGWLVVSDRGQQCARLYPTTPVLPPQWLRGIERQPPHTHVACALRRVRDAPGPCSELCLGFTDVTTLAVDWERSVPPGPAV